MENQIQESVNPFALMMDPESVLRAVECSERLKRLHSRVCRPLDKNQAPKEGAEASESDDSDAGLSD